MRICKFLVALLCLFGCWAIVDRAQDKSDEETVRGLETKWTEAYQQRKVDVLASMLADDYVITMEEGTTYSKMGFVSYNMGPLRVDSAELSDVKIHLRQNVAVVTGAYHERGVDNGKPYDYHDRMTDVWMKNAGKWQLIASHYSVPVTR